MHFRSKFFSFPPNLYLKYSSLKFSHRTPGLVLYRFHFCYNQLNYTVALQQGLFQSKKLFLPHRKIYLLLASDFHLPPDGPGLTLLLSKPAFFDSCLIKPTCSEYCCLKLCCHLDSFFLSLYFSLRYYSLAIPTLSHSSSTNSINSDSYNSNSRY